MGSLLRWPINLYFFCTTEIMKGPAVHHSCISIWYTNKGRKSLILIDFEIYFCYR